MVKSKEIKGITEQDVRRLFCTDKRYEHCSDWQRANIDRKARALLAVSKLNIQTLENYLQLNYVAMQKKKLLDCLNAELCGIKTSMPLV